MDTDRGRKTVGGKIEVILKIREPLVDKDIEVVNEKWLVLDSHLRTLQMVNNTSCPDIYLYSFSLQLACKSCYCLS